ncbi:PAS domain-containing sensor histidine kinase [Dyadobacter sp. CY107]|uniref:histidine kinase n=1 Tax=Dyadobacter chenwenxiniae TaxID=2906456 RepID=A0A9X1PK82_9BACT|nr:MULTISPECIES: PAS domain-containing sensor histidine kinase [Dyadobacter]MCF0062610.1 PAS domain-containing sensor histidine kinase [Dyadobacter chenwenxiniae]MCF2504766.1 PAS domain-containing sensor histidine kinase [Dyadobacter fanqingshengii]UON83643.1 PAS domain-containing sensor histidine kinase [Dyadobacter chenwenxiniae]
MLDALFKHATEGIVVVDKAGAIVMLNPKAKELFGYPDLDLIGKKIETLIPQRFAANHVHYRDHYLEAPRARGMGHLMDLFARKFDGSEFPVEVSLSPFQTSDGEFVVSFVIDITERKKQENRIREANLEIQKLNAELEERVEQRTRELAEAVKKVEDSQEEVIRALKKEKELNNMKSQFVTIASHEFRTPLATILSSASLIGRYGTTEEEEKRQKHVKRIKSAVTNLTEILNDFLSIGKLEEGRVHSIPVQVELEDFCKNLIDEIQGLCKEKQQIHLQYTGNTEVWLDKQLLRNILFNLLSNGIKYSDAGKEITLKINAEADHVDMAVHDEGIGIPEKDQPNVFDRFFRAHNAGATQGTGLGLNIVKDYVTLMGGNVTFSSETGKGTTFFVYLPNVMPAQVKMD